MLYRFGIIGCNIQHFGNLLNFQTLYISREKDIESIFDLLVPKN